MNFFLFARILNLFLFASTVCSKGCHGDRIGDVAEQRVAPAQAVDHLRRGEHAVGGVQREVAVLAQERDDGGREFAGEEDLRFHGAGRGAEDVEDV